MSVGMEEVKSTGSSFNRYGELIYHHLQHCPYLILHGSEVNCRVLLHNTPNKHWCSTYNVYLRKKPQDL